MEKLEEDYENLSNEFTENKLDIEDTNSKLSSIMDNSTVM